MVIIVTLIFAGLSTRLDISMRWSDLLPENDVRTLQFNKILKEFSTATSLVVMVQGDEKDIKAFAESIAPKIQAIADTTHDMNLRAEIEKLNVKLASQRQKQGDKIKELEAEIRARESAISQKLVKRIDYKTEIDFLKKNGLLLVKEEDLENIKDIFYDANLSSFITNLNNSMEKEYVGREESISTRQKKDNAVIFLDGISDILELVQKYNNSENVSDEQARKVIDKLLYGEPYMLSFDENALVMNVIPTFSLMEIDKTILCTQIVQGLVDKELRNFPQVQAGLTGMVALSHDEMIYSEQSLGITSVIAFIAILVMLIIAFRMLVAPFMAILNLIIGIIWAMGVAAITVGELNMMTYMFTVILIGLGIDFSIHIISGFTENRALHLPIDRAMNNTLVKIGQGILTGGITTAIAFLTLFISSSRGMKEMGLVSGFGLLAIMVSTFLFLPALLVLRERRKEKRSAGKVTAIPTDISFTLLGQSAHKLARYPVITLLLAISITVVLVISAFHITFDHNYMNIEPEGLTSIALQDSILEKFDLSMDYGMVLTSNIDESRKVAEEYRKTASVAIVDDISLYLPSITAQQLRQSHIDEIRERLAGSGIRNSVSPGEFDRMLKELDRLEMNIMEMQDMAYLGGQDKVDKKCRELVGDPENEQTLSLVKVIRNELTENAAKAPLLLSQYQRQAAPYFKSSVLKMCDGGPVRFDDLPESIKDRYSNKTRDQFMVTVFPTGNIWKDAEFLNRFADDLEKTSPNATGMPPVFRALMQVIGKDGRNAAMLTIILMFFVLWFDFKNAGYALMAMLPLAAGVFWMVGTMHLIGQQLTVMNVMGLPLIIGIGIDDGVHIMHRWINEGKKDLKKVFASTGKAILLTSMTTMLGFGSLVFSIWRGFGQLGSALFIGVATCFLTTIFILPGIIGLLHKD